MEYQQYSRYVLIADDHPLFRDAMGRVVASTLPDYAVVDACSFADVMAATGKQIPGLILLDINMPGMDGLSGLITLRNHVPAAPVIIVSADEAPSTIRQAMMLGAVGFIPKSMDHAHMEKAVQTVMEGEVFIPIDLHDPHMSPHTALSDAEFHDGYAALTAHQRKVLEMLVAGKANKTIAYEMGISESTVKGHVSAILAKLKVTSRTQAVLNAHKLLAMRR